MPPTAAPRSMRSVPPWTRGDFRGVLNVEQTHPGAARPRGVFSRLHLRATPPREGIFKAAPRQKAQPR